MKQILYLIIFVFLLQSCGLFGVHINVHNPRKPGVQRFSKEQILLGELNVLRECYDVHHYDFSLEVFPEKKSLKGVVEIHATALLDFEQFQIDLDDPFTILSLKEKGSTIDLSYSREERAVFVDLAKQKGENFVLEVAYEGKPTKADKAPWKGGFVWDKDGEKNPWIGVACESDGASLWWPLKDHTSDEADSVRLHYTVPEGLTAIGNGQLENTSTQNGKSTYDWFVSYPINSYNVTIYVGKFKLIEDVYNGINGQKLTLNHYVLPENYVKAKKHFLQLDGILRCFEETFGEYPWYRDGFKLVQSPYAGMEHQTAIAYGNGFENNGYGIDYIILHETAHEWWGNSVTARDLADVWIQEGFATYAEVLYYEKHDGKWAYDSEMYWTRMMIKNKFPVIGVEDRRCFHFRKNSDVYGKGSWILHSLRSQINNDTTFFDIIQTFYADYAYGLTDSQDFILIVKEKTGMDYQWFFDRYLYVNTVPRLEYEFVENTFYYRWGNVIDKSEEQFGLEVTINDNSQIIYPKESVQSIEVLSRKDGSWEVLLGDNILYEKKKKRGLHKE